MRALVRTADPWTDTAVIDARAPRTNQAIVGTLSLLAFVTGWWPILGLLAAQLAIGLRFGRRWCLPCLLYFDVIQPRFGEGPIEDPKDVGPALKRAIDVIRKEGRPALLDTIVRKRELTRFR